MKWLRVFFNLVIYAAFSAWLIAALTVGSLVLLGYIAKEATGR